MLSGAPSAPAARWRAFEPWYLLVLLVLLAALAWFFPYSGDDWAWGSQIGTARLDTWFRDYNGRYAGNLAVLVLTRVPVLDHVVIAATLCLTVFLLQHLTDNRTRSGYLLTTLLLLSMPLPVWRQSISWTSGFSNYALVMPLALLFLVSARDEWLARGGRSRLLLVPLPLLGFVGALFMEHVTTYLLAAALAHVALFAVVRRKVPWRGLLWCVGVLGGAAVMFSNGAYRNAAKAGAYQHIGPAPGDDGGSTSPVKQLATSVSRMAVVDNVFLNWVLVLLVLVLAVTVLRSDRRLAVVLGLAGGFLALVSAVGFAGRYDQLRSPWKGLAGIGLLLLVTLLALTAWLLVQDRVRRWQLVAGAASVVVIVLPLSSVQPIGPRCFYASYVVLLGVASLLLREVSAQVAFDTDRLAPVLGGLVATLLVLYFVAYVGIHHAADARLAKIRQAVDDGKAAVTVRPLPYPGFVHDPDPSRFPLEDRYKLFYDLPKELTIKVRAPAGRTSPVGDRYDRARF